MMPRSSSTSAPVSGVPSAASRRSAAPRGSGVEREGDEHRALALDQVVAGRLARLLRVAEDAEQVVAQLERLAQGQAEAAELLELAGVGPGEGGADVDRALDGVLGGLVAQHRHRRVDVGAAARLHGDVEELPGDDLVAALLEEGQPGSDLVGGEAAAAQHVARPSRAAGRRAGSRRRRRTARGSPRQPAARCSASNARWVAGRPRRVSEASMKSSWTSALACSTSREAHARASAASSSTDGRIARWPQWQKAARNRLPPLHRRTRLGDQPAGVGTERGELGRPLVEEGVQHLLDLVAEVGGVPGRHAVCEPKQWTRAPRRRGRSVGCCA